MIDQSLQKTSRGVLIRLHVQPRASKNEVVGLQGDSLKVRLTSPPVDGAANKSCCFFMAKILGISKGSISIVSGDKSRHKVILVEGAGIDNVKHALSSQVVD